MKKIPLDQLQAKTNLGVQIKTFLPDDTFEQKAADLGAHRDDHYIFFLLKKGSGSLMIDLQKVDMKTGQLYYILPGQVHQHIRIRRAEGWFLAIDTSLVPAECRNVFEGKLSLQLPCTLQPALFQQYCHLLTLLQQRYAGANKARLDRLAIYALLQSFLAMAATTYDDLPEPNHTLSRPAELARQFRMLMAKNIRTIKSPSGYSTRLNVSPSYLNESVKHITGFPVSYWIQQDILLEAKRLLYYSEFNVKQIAYELGYEDPSYFSRFFRRAAGMSALEFRALYRK
jgi:AraC-like DNA-binding protein/mannose-6-phosphate isomerase-like protein (cupin superfamily)